MNTRPKTYTIAAIMTFVFSALGLATTFPSLAQGSIAVNHGLVDWSYVLLVISMITNAMGLVSAYGVWRNQKWGVILTIILSVLNGLPTLPGVVFAPTVGIKLLAATATIINIIIIALLLWPKPKSTPAASSNV